MGIFYGGIEDFDPHVSNRGYWNCVCRCVAQMSTMFVEQGMLMNTTIGSSPFLLLSTFDVISVICWPGFSYSSNTGDLPGLIRTYLIEADTIFPCYVVPF
uniref:Uncharacterized protein n=1 Tax=Salix viminalis TaxID=40686 RepID=A0A6N2LWP3_SALVM